MYMRYLAKIISVVLIVTTIPACVTFEQNPISGNKRAYGYSWEEEIKIGRDADREIIAQYGLYEDDEQLTNYVSGLGQELLEVSHLRRENTDPKFKNTEFTFRVLDSPVVNAFALPGGFVYVTRGLLGHLNNEAQLAVVLGHEIGHVAARHASQRAVEQQFGQLAVLGGAVIGQSVGLDGGNILQLSSQAAQLLFLSYSREDERESDRLGVEYAAKEGYKAAEGAEFFTSLKRISEKEGFNIPSHLSSHPDPGEREKNIPRLAAEWEQEGYQQTITDKQEYLNRIEDIMYGDNPRQGFVENGTFYHPDLKFQFDVPAGFNVANQPSQVVVYNDNQDAVIIFSIDNKHATPEASVEALLAQEGITEGSKTQIRANGYPGFRATASAQTQDGTRLALVVTAIEFQGNIYQFLSYTTEGQYNTYREDFLGIPDSFLEVTDPDVLNVKPVRLKVIRAEKNAPFREFLPDPLPMDIQPLDVAIINQVELDQPIQKGQLLKMPVQG